MAAPFGAVTDGMGALSKNARAKALVFVDCAPIPGVEAPKGAAT